MDGRELRIKVFLEEASDMPAVHKRQVHNKCISWQCPKRESTHLEHTEPFHKGRGVHWLITVREWLHPPTCYEARHSVGTPPSKEMQVQRFFRKVMAG